MKPFTRWNTVQEARRWKGTPFRHQGRLHGVAVDCAGLIEMVPQRFGRYTDCNVAPYKKYPDPIKMGAELRKHLDPITFSEILPADILWFRIDVDAQHLALISETDPDLMMIHAFGRPKIMKCIEQRVDQFWKSRLVGCYRYRGIS